MPMAALSGNRDVSNADGFYLDPGSFGQGCNGDCSVTVLAGRQVVTTMAALFGVADFTQGEYGFVPMTPIWDWEWGDSGFVGGAYSRRLLSFGHSNVGEVISLEGEVGLGQRFGIQTETELWSAIYLRWHLFPWNDYVKTSVGVSTGLSYTTGISDWEIDRSGNDEGSRLLHYLSPEATFALPDNPNKELVLRLTHRSGGSNMFGSNSIFNNTDGGAQYFTIGLRSRF